MHVVSTLGAIPCKHSIAGRTHETKGARRQKEVLLCVGVLSPTLFETNRTGSRSERPWCFLELLNSILLTSALKPTADCLASLLAL